MAYPKTKEELKIYKELLEKYKDDPDILDIIKWDRDDKTDHRSWEQIRDDIEFAAWQLGGGISPTAMRMGVTVEDMVTQAKVVKDKMGE